MKLTKQSNEFQFIFLKQTPDKMDFNQNNDRHCDLIEEHLIYAKNKCT